MQSVTDKERQINEISKSIEICQKKETFRLEMIEYTDHEKILLKKRNDTKPFYA